MDHEIMFRLIKRLIVVSGSQFTLVKIRAPGELRAANTHGPKMARPKPFIPVTVGKI